MATFKVRHSDGTEHEVQGDKLALAEADGYLPVVSNGKEEHRVSASKLGIAEKDGFVPVNDDSALSRIMAGVKGFARGASMDLADEAYGVVGAIVNPTDSDKDFVGRYRDSRDYARRQDHKDDVQHEGITTGTRIGGGVATSILTGAAGNTLKGSTAIGATSGLGNSDADLTDPSLENYAQAALDTAAGAGMGAAGYGVAKAAPHVVKGAKEGAKKLASLIPGTEGASATANKWTAKLASMMPYQSATADELYELLSNPDLRRKASASNFVDDARNISPDLQGARDSLEEAVGKRFGQLEEQSLRVPYLAEGLGDVPFQKAMDDIDATHSLIAEITDQGKTIANHENLYGSKVHKLYQDAGEILDKGSPSEKGSPTYMKSFIEHIENQIGDDKVKAIGEALGSAKSRTLEARRHIDDFMRNKNWENLSRYEKEAIGNLRTSLDDHLKTKFSGADTRRDADALYSGARQSIDDFFKPLTSRSPSGESFLDPSKLKSHVKTGSARGKTFDDRLQALQDFVVKHGGDLDNGAADNMDAAIKKIDELSKLGNMQMLQQNLDRAGGGPTSQMINFVAQVGAGASSSGLSAIAMPITNPAAWVRFVDGLAGVGKSAGSKTAPLRGRALPLANYFKKLMMERGPAAVAASHQALMNNDPEYKKLVEESAAEDANAPRK